MDSEINKMCQQKITTVMLGVAALVAVVVFFLQMPETAEPETTE
jgi:hypothetical protein